MGERHGSNSYQWQLMAQSALRLYFADVRSPSLSINQERGHRQTDSLSVQKALCSLASGPLLLFVCLCRQAPAKGRETLSALRSSAQDIPAARADLSGANAWGNDPLQPSPSQSDEMQFARSPLPGRQQLAISGAPLAIVIADDMQGSNGDMSNAFKVFAPWPRHACVFGLRRHLLPSLHIGATCVVSSAIYMG